MRALISIGCNDYQNFKKLNGAEKDAKNIFELLIKPDIGGYDKDRSRLLLSPTMDEVRRALSDVLFTSPKPETFSFFFAGHGCVSAGSFYMLVKESCSMGLSISALSLTDIFRSLNEATPLQSNIIIDACESGGLIEDLGMLLKSSILGNYATPRLTLVATSAQNQYAGDTLAGGYGTLALIDCITGEDFVQDHAETLDLVEIGMRLSQRFENTVQNPVVWGINLYSTSGFCKNPRFGMDPTSSLKHSLKEMSIQSQEIIKEHFDSLWSTYSAISGVWDHQEFSQAINTVLRPLLSNPIELSRLADVLAVTFDQQATQSNDPFRKVEVVLTIAVALLPSIQHAEVAATAQRLVSYAHQAIINASNILINDLGQDVYALISKKGGLHELYALPIRLSKVLGWAAAGTFFSSNQQAKDASLAILAKIISYANDKYCNSVVLSSDSEAASWCVVLAACSKFGLQDDGEILAGLLFNSFVKNKGCLATVDLPNNKILDYLLARYNQDYSECPELVARPVESLTVLFKAAEKLGLGKVFDDSLWLIDGLSFGAYIPKSYTSYGEMHMKDGENFIWTVGLDVFRVENFLATWPSQEPRPDNSLTASLAVAASLLYCDRQAWFLFE